MVFTQWVKTMALSTEDKDRIDAMGQTDMARVIRFTHIGQWPFNDDETGAYFLERFNELGGMTPEVSKLIGWDRS